MEKNNQPHNSGKIVLCNIGIQVGEEGIKTSHDLAEALRHIANMIENDQLVEEAGTIVEQAGADENGGIFRRPIHDSIGDEVGQLSFIEE